MDALELEKNEPIAVTGLACRFPGHANDPAAFWRMLRDGVDAISEVPKSRWDVDAFYDPDPDAPGKTYTRFGGFIDGVDEFDPHFFGISPREARSIDPQHRLFLEVAWQALEQAQQSPAGLHETRTGVFVGITASDYAALLKVGGPEHLDAYHLTGCSLNFVAGRLSHVLGLQGPAMAIDTACSSSLVAVHLACQSLRGRECDIALAGGVNALLTPDTFITAAKARMLAADGRCKTFDARANGYVRGEGCGVIVLRRLRDAIARGDRILAVVRGSAVNQDGPSSGLTVPNKLAQEALIRQALVSARVSPAQVGYVEAHGTGTPLGDPIEVRALAAVLGEGRPAADPFLLGSVKTNIGHLESAAGIAGLIKTILALEHEAVPPHLHLETPTPHVAWQDVPARIPTRLTPWTRGEQPRIAAVSSFGGSGTNAHVILEEGPHADRPAPRDERPVHVLTLSARTTPALRAFAARFDAHLAAADDALADVAFTANTARTAFSERAAIVASSREEARAALRACADGTPSPALFEARVSDATAPKVAFLFTGQGSQYVGMGRALYHTQPVFRGALDRCDQILRPLLERPLLAVMFGEDTAAAALLDRTDYTQPALFAIEWALAELWQSWGVRPAAVMGHSVGEYVAACRAGLFSLEDGLRLIAERARLMAALPQGGAMAAMLAPEVRVVSAVSRVEGVSIAALNGPENTVISGPAAAVAEVQRQLEGEGIRSRRLAVSHAFHSSLLDPMLDRLEDAASRVTFQASVAPDVAMVSNLTGARATRDELAQPAYWRRHARQPVRFAEGMQALRDLGCDLFVEIGPAPVLVGMGARCVSAGAAAWLPTLRQGIDDWSSVCRTLGALWTHGVSVDWAAFDREWPRRGVFAPAGPFQRERLWIEATPTRERRGAAPAALAARGTHPLLGSRVRTAATSEVIFEAQLSPGAVAFLDGHRINGTAVVPATAYVDGMLSAAQAAHGRGVSELFDLTIREACAVADEAARVVQVIVGPLEGEACTCRVFSTAADAAEDAAWTLHATATVRSASTRARAESLEAIRARTAEPVDVGAHYRRLEEVGLSLGPTFRAITGLWRGAGEAVARIEGGRSDNPAVVIDPGVLDACVQAVAPVVFTASSEALFVPLSIGRCAVDGSVSGRLWSHAVARSLTGDAAVLDLHVFDDQGRVVIEIERLTLRAVSRSAFGAPGAPRDWFCRVEWEPRTPDEADAPAAAWLPKVDDLLRDVNSAVNFDDPSFGVRAFNEHLPELNRLATAYMVGALRELGWRPQIGEVVHVESFADRLGVIPAHRRFLARILEMLAEDGVLVAAAGGWRVEATLPATDVAQLEARLRQCANCAPEMGLMTRVGQQLASALRGGCDVVDLLFPQGSLALAERLYEASPLFSPYNAAIQEAVGAAVSRVPAGRRARVLEIGAGTGATTARLLPRMPAGAVEYTFTDVSPVFLAKAREKFKAHAFVDYRLLDIERDPSAQGFADGGFDVVVAANVLHATVDLRTTLRHVQRLLAPGGLLILLEGARPLRIGDLIVGLTDGWWRFADRDLRPAHALMAPSRWLQVLEETGFASAATIPAVNPDSGALAYHMVVMARGASQGAREVASVAASTPRASGSWLVFADASGVGAQVGQLLRERGARVIAVQPGDRFAAIAEAVFAVNPAHPDDFVSLLRAVRRADPAGCAGIVHAWSLDLEGEASPTDSLRLGTGAVLHLVQAMEREQATSSPLWLITRGAQHAGGPSHPVAVAQAPLWGLANTIEREHPELRCSRVDLDPFVSDDEAQLLLRELLAPSKDHHLAFRGRDRYAARLVPAQLGAASVQQEDTSPVQLFVDAPGAIDGIGFRAAERRAPGQGEVEIGVEATGLNFRDVLRALGMYPDDTGDPLGVECAGRITRLGADVRGLEIGQRVVAIANGSFGTYVTAPADLVAPVTDEISAAEGATIPSAFVTAQYGLVTLADLRRGERVLIHAAAGGVGLAAVQVAQRAGAEVFATAGSARKREYLRSLGIAHVFDSRSTTFADDVRAATGGEGVDVVLNSLSGDFIAASVGVLRASGRFVEIGRRGIWTVERFREAQPQGSYFIVNLAETCRTQPALIGGVLRNLVAAVADRTLRPLPFAAFASSQVIDAFRHMAQARHIGKVVVTRGTVAARWRIDPEASYLVTGGLSGVGLRVAEWMVDNGARHLVLMGRRAPSDAAAASIAALERRGAAVVISRGDAARMDDVRAALARVPAGTALRGVMHCAGVLDDGVLAQLDLGRFATVMAPKVTGSWNLHALTRGMELDFFVLFSSAVSILGSAGQGNHAAACAYQDALAWHRVALGVPGCSINWGPWSDIGSVVRQNVGDRLKTKGLHTFGPEDGLTALDAVLRNGVPHVTAIRADWPAYVREVYGNQQPAFFERLTRTVRPTTTAPTAATREEDLASQLSAATPSERHKLLEAHVRRQIATVLGLDGGFRLEPQHGLRDLGIDSLMSIELRNRLQATIGRSLPSTLAFDYPTVAALTEFIATQVLEFEAADAAQAAVEEMERERAAVVAEIGRLSQDEAEALLLEELSRAEDRRPV